MNLKSILFSKKFYKVKIDFFLYKISEMNYYDDFSLTSKQSKQPNKDKTKHKQIYNSKHIRISENKKLNSKKK